MARAPLRIGLAGGGTDFESYYEVYGGAVVSVAINRYCYVLISSQDGKETEITSSVDFHKPQQDGWQSSDTDLPVPRAVVDYFGLGRGLSIFIAFQVPSDTGLGSSTASGVALIRALESIKGPAREARDLAELACHIEIRQLGRLIGKQDPYTCTFGGLNYLEFRPDGVGVTPIALSAELRDALESRLMLFFTGRRQNSARIWHDQWMNTQRNGTAINALHTIKAAAAQLHRELQRGEIDGVGDCLHRSWIAKRQLAVGVSDAWVDEWYEAALKAGAGGGKLVGAGGGGFALLYCDPDRQEAVTGTLQKAGLSRVMFQFESEGATVLFDEPDLPRRTT
ncbi:MAG: GHMP kinase [Candidatus Dormibacter sp.]